MQNSNTVISLLLQMIYFFWCKKKKIILWNNWLHSNYKKTRIDLKEIRQQKTYIFLKKKLLYCIWYFHPQWKSDCCHFRVKLTELCELTTTDEWIWQLLIYEMGVVIKNIKMWVQHSRRRNNRSTSHLSQWLRTCFVILCFTFFSKGH